ncbi:site-specific DNA-methyltransferase [Polaromonas sp. DSR2-3-2]|uniref:site-specific DNA-methyltransferase n=1 Tax=unclassified Polaromonas TaxID=2638319 RepID=UPI003CF76AF5
MSQPDDLLKNLEHLSAAQLRRLLTEHLTKQKLGLYWESSAIERDAALNANIVLPRLSEADSHGLAALGGPGTANLVIEGDNFDSLRLLKSTHAGKIRVIYIDPPYNTGNKDWVYNDRFVGANDRWRHSQWLEFLFQRLLLARDLLTQDGVIMVSINDENRARLELLMDEVFPGRRLGTITWRTRQGSNADQQCFLSVDHEHVLVYGNPGFKFNGFEKSYQMYGNADNDLRGDWRTSDLTLGFSFKERPNLYYPLQDTETGIYYPPNPDRIWVYASESRLKEGQTVQAKTMDEFIRLKQILFPKEQRVETWPTMDALLAAIDSGDVPRSGKSPILRRDLPNLEFWVGKPVGFGRPAFKRYKADLRNQTQPLSSWIVPTFEDGDYEAENSLVSATNQEGARQVAEIFGNRAFNYAKPISLIQGLLAQASRPGDTILDFFAGSGTTGHAVLALNALDGGNRKFILCSSTEATAKEPAKNLCRDVCAARIKKVIESDAALSGNSFAYLQLDKLAPGDAPFDSSCAQAFQLLTLRLGQVARPVPATDRGVKVLVQNTGDGALTVLCHKLTRAALDALAALPCRQLRVYSTRPATVREHFQALGREVESLSLAQALLHGQQSPRARRKAVALPPDATNSIASHADAASASGLNGTENSPQTPSESASS